MRISLAHLRAHFLAHIFQVFQWLNRTEVLDLIHIHVNVATFGVVSGCHLTQGPRLAHMPRLYSYTLEQLVHCFSV